MIFTDAQEMAIKHPETFEAPSKKELESLKPGSYVKVSVMSERFWCEIISIDGENIVARVDNDLVCTDEHGISCDDIIKFEKRNIYNIDTPKKTFH